ncbi:MAG: methyltransferase domain-containing protein [Alphaproteobacteria bacterium]|nr:methyltransferase domain-containing protein [Alphaproteobacteria bacterium]
MDAEAQPPQIGTHEGLNIQYGACRCAAPGWLNFDASPSVWLERLPVIGRFVRVNTERFPEEILFGDIITGLPVEANSAKAVYASHVLEHLAYNDCLKALRNTLAILKPNGVFRLIVPDLEARARVYLSSREENCDAANDFCRSTSFGVSDRPKGLIRQLRNVLGNANHLWMWDERSMAAALRGAGFVGIRRCQLGDAEDRDFDVVESPQRFFDDDWKIVELALEARKPSVG